MKFYNSIVVFLFTVSAGFSQIQMPTKITPIGKGWANNSINVVPYRKNSLVTFQGIQYTAFYDSAHYVVLAKRKSNSPVWEIAKTQYKGDVFDAHNSISIGVDGQGYLHVSWDHHSWGKHLTPLNYCKSLSPGSLKLSKKLMMTGLKEDKITYPEFYRLINGDLLFFYRDGESGSGNVMLNRYAVKTGKWTQVQSSFIDGENLRNPYWQIALDKKGVIHMSWTWRESPDVATNHDVCYARSADGGKTWTRSDGTKYQLPIKEARAECVAKIPQKSELINQVSMTTDHNGNPYIASYWKEKGAKAPQYHLLYLKQGRWINLNLNFRERDFSLSGGGTKGIPIARPQVLVWDNGTHTAVALIFRDVERQNSASIAICKDLDKPVWVCEDLSLQDLGAWEPSYDTELWNSKNVLNLLLQKVQQKDNDGQIAMAPQMLSVLEWKPLK
ncbi:BNR repeat-containing family member [Pedobacter sp. ok626]|uniref:BNR repeat-containing protein n=1 Tax=Pedobacter sp. ok626 TaxID=1761882 RepID=UPI00088450AC|nr:BNR repeat-containing protein [Pedobacter sp. ok626]SDK01070.1 BNR repeat-containing family member [Pedobacter sp. ok626]